MIFSCQVEPLNELDKLSKVSRQSVLIEGPSGCGKSYLGHQYANMLDIRDFVSVAPKVSDIREALDSSAKLSTDVLLLVENLDTGVAAASYTLLKSLEEPQPNVFIVITCRNIKMIPDTIISRSAVISANIPLSRDLDDYGKLTDSLKYQTLKDRLVWKCCRSFLDVDEVFHMTPDQVNYYESLSQVCTFSDNISGLAWTLGHYADNSPCNVELAVRCIMELMHNTFITRCGVDCLNELSMNRIAQHAILAKFLFNAKYCE